MTGGSLKPLLLAGCWIGLGMGGFVDGIVLHQILQLHNMLSGWVPRDTLLHEQVNMFWDGLFHAFTWIAVAVGLRLLWRAVSAADAVLSGRALWGSILFGWGLFNVVEGVVDHEMLGVHHVYEKGNHPLWDMVFLGFGVGLLVVGVALVRARGMRCPSGRHAAPLSALKGDRRRTVGAVDGPRTL